MDIQEFKKIFLTKTGKINAKKASEKWIDATLLNEINEKTAFLSNDVSITLRIRCIIEEIVEHPKCVVCGNPVKIYQGRVFKRTCCWTCSQKDPVKIENMKKNTDYITLLSKTRATNLAKYGSEYSFSRKEVVEKIANARRNATNKREIYDRANKTFNENYPVGSIEREQLYSKRKAARTLTIYGKDLPEHCNSSVLVELLKKNNGNVIDSAKELGVAFSTLYKSIHTLGLDSHIETFKSRHESEIINFIKSFYLGEIISNTRSIISPNELDIYIPEKNIAIEFNGIFWHSEISGGKSRKYHLNKTNVCEQKGIRLFHIFENEWNEPTKKEIWKSIIRNALGFTENKIHARKCEIKDVSTKEANVFFNSNHLQGGNKRSKRNIALMYNGEIVACMSFCKPRFSKKTSWELLRFAIKINTSISGAASKIMKAFGKDSLLSYADKRYSSGRVYESLGFTRLKDSDPAYWYVDENKNLHNRMKFQKHKLNSNESEWRTMQSRGYDRIWDCGNSVWILNV